jgi:ribosomal protein S12 methylthiotransferase accessory factor
LKLRNRVPKAIGSGVHREKPSEWTYEQVRPYFRHLGITRVADVTGLDRLGIPVYNAVVPRSNDVLSAYHGKGLTAIDAKTSAVMEAAERASGGLPLRPAVVASFDDLAAAGRTVLRPGDVNIALLPQYRDDLPIYWLAGHDLLSDGSTLVPYGAVSYVDCPGAPPCYELTTSNGMASGNSLEEAICHALCELIERDAVTISDVVTRRLRQFLNGVPLPRENPHLDLDALPLRVQPLAARFRDVNIELRLAYIASDIAIPTVLAVATEHGDFPKSHRGFGTHPDIETALIRAITECAQGRALDEGSNEDEMYVQPGEGALVNVKDLPTYPTDDIVADIALMLDRLRACGLSRVIAVDLSPPEIPVHVVRLLVPGLESWAIDHSRLGTRATRAWNEAVQAVLGRQP